MLPMTNKPKTRGRDRYVITKTCAGSLVRLVIIPSFADAQLGCLATVAGTLKTPGGSRVDIAVLRLGAVRARGAIRPRATTCERDLTTIFTDRTIGRRGAILTKRARIVSDRRWCRRA